MTRSCPISRIPLLLTLLVLSGCSVLEQQVEQRSPEARVEGVRVSGLNFEQVRLLVDVQVDNPNPVSVRIAGLDYEVRLHGERAFSGESREPSEVPARGSAMVSVPITLTYRELYEGIAGLRGRDRVDFDVDVGLDVGIPLLGNRRLSASTSDTLPLPKWPGVSLSNLRIERLGLDGASVVLDLGVYNPNSFGLTVDGLRYDFSVNGRDWARGELEQSAVVDPDGRATLSIPVDVDFAALGSGVYRMLLEGGALDYQLSGRLAGTAGEGFPGQFELELNDSGEVSPDR